MDFLFGIVGAVIISFILSIIFSLGEKKHNEGTFLQKFSGILIVLIIIVIIGNVLRISGCSSDDDPDYPMKYSPQ